MRKTRRWAFLCLLLLLHLGGGAAEEKTEVMMPGAAAAMSPPEGNTTFVEGITWCVAVPGVSQADLQNALDWACGLGKADCRPIQHGGACYQPDTLLSHASYAFNSYYHQNGNSDVACNFGGTATITKHDPGYGKCSFAVSEPERSASTILVSYTWRLTSILLLLHLGIKMMVDVQTFKTLLA